MLSQLGASRALVTAGTRAQIPWQKGHLCLAQVLCGCTALTSCAASFIMHEPYI